MQKVKLGNVLLSAEGFFDNERELFWRLEDGARCSCEAGESGTVLKMTGLVDFTTFLNGLSALKWRTYAAVERAWLHLEVEGSCTLALTALRGAPGTAVEREVTAVSDLSSPDGFTAFDVEVPLACVVAGFAVMAQDEVRLRDAYYYTERDEAEIAPIELALCTTTFKKERFIEANIERIRAGVLAGDDELSGHFQMFVVDNGRTLDAAALSHGGVTVIPNDNAGGAGGFARGMLAALDAGTFTHVVLMDDDVYVLPESFKRLFALLRLATSAYRGAFVAGAMMELERPSLLFEDVSQMLPSGAWSKVKPNTPVGGLAGIVDSEVRDVEVDHAYGGWWFNCIPISAIRENGLPLPFFVRFDDVEFGLRNKPVFMTMNGICVWHEGFAGRFNAAVACYQYVRNLLVVASLHDEIDKRAIMARYWRTFNIWLRTLDYGAAELWLDGLEDYLKGPEFLMEADGEQIMRENAAKCEKLVAVAELDPEVLEALGRVDPAWLSGDYERSLLRKVASTVPHDRHWLPAVFLSDVPGPVVPGLGESATPWTRTACRTRLVALSPDGKRAALRELDRDRYRKLRTRYRQLTRRFWREDAELAARWRARGTELTSQDFWRRKLGLGEGPGCRV